MVFTGLFSQQKIILFLRKKFFKAKFNKFDEMVNYLIAHGAEDVQVNGKRILPKKLNE